MMMSQDAHLSSLTQYLKEYNRLVKADQSAETLKVAILRSFSCEMLEAILTVEADRAGFKTSFFIGGYQQYAQEILDPGSALYAFEPQVIILAVSLEDILPQSVRSYYENRERIEALAQEALEDYSRLLSKLRSSCSAQILVCNFLHPPQSPEASYQDQHLFGLPNIVRKMNLDLVALTAGLSQVFIVDMEACVFKIGLKDAYDHRMQQVAKNPYSFVLYAELARKIASILRAVFGRRKKALVLDLDNTLWRGIVGEDGPRGVTIDQSYQNFQRQLLNWSKTGLLLAINSKNNPEDALEVIEHHPDMVLRPNDFAAVQINWNDKAGNMRRIADELNIGLDSLVFFDDSPAECELIRRELPQAEVVQLDGQAMRYADLVRYLPGLDFVSLTSEDLNRADLYKTRRERETFKDGFTDLDAYLKALEMRIIFERLNEETLTRSAQLTQKTNQFNLTARRYTESDLQTILAAGGFGVTVKVEDRFGDNGLVGLTVIKPLPERESEKWVIDVFLLSCRVMGRRVEDALLGHIWRLAKAGGVKSLIGEYRPTSKNKPVESLYARLGFVASNGQWELDIEAGFSYPDYFEIVA